MGSMAMPRCCAASPRTVAVIGDALAEPDMQRLIAREALQGDPWDLKRR